MRRYSSKLQWKAHWNTTWLRYPLWIWMAFSVLCWFGLSKPTQMLITPYVCSTLLLGTALMLCWARMAISTHPKAEGVRRELRDMLLAICTTAVIGLLFPWLFRRMAGDPPSEVACMLAWVLCSAGFVLSLMVSKLLISIVRHIGDAAPLSS